MANKNTSGPRVPGEAPDDETVGNDGVSDESGFDLTAAILGMDETIPAAPVKTSRAKQPRGKPTAPEAETPEAEPETTDSEAATVERRPRVKPVKVAKKPDEKKDESGADESDADETDGAETDQDEEKPVRQASRKLTQAPVKKARPTRKRDEVTESVSKRTTPFMFVRQSVGELKKVVWPAGDVVGQYFLVVLVFVLVIMGFVFGLDQLFGWGLLKLMG